LFDQLSLIFQSNVIYASITINQNKKKISEGG
jgi:hypothetical protein